MTKGTLCALVVVVIIFTCFLHFACRRAPEDSLSSPARHPKFISSATFCGKRKGYAFRTDEGVTGYYTDEGVTGYNDDGGG